MAEIREALTAVLLCGGTAFLVLAAVGVVRMPDVFLRISAISKASTLGVGCVLLATALASDDLGVRARAVATVVFVFLTTPVASHMLGRAAYRCGAPMWRGTVVDELHGYYDGPPRAATAAEPPTAREPETGA